MTRCGNFLVGLLVTQAATGCAGYFSDDSVEVVGVDKRTTGGYARQINRPTRTDDKYFQVNIGYKRLAAYGGDTRAAAEAESKRITAERRYCPRGYQIHANPNVRSGTYGYYWIIECNE